MSMPAVCIPSVLESSESHFRNVFGTHRGCGGHCWTANFPAGTLHYLETKYSEQPFLWITDEEGGAGRGQIRYSSSHELWCRDAAGQLALLAPALSIGYSESAEHGLEWIASTWQPIKYLLFSTSGEYARLARRPNSGHSTSWGAEEFSSDPAGAWGEVMARLA